MVRERYHEKLQKLEKDLVNMSGMVSEAIEGAVESLVQRDFKASKEIIKNDVVINKLRFKIEERCLRLIATQQPMARDLRTIAAILNIITDLERKKADGKAARRCAANGREGDFHAYTVCRGVHQS